MTKNFKTVEELVALLESRGVETDEMTPKAIVRESYYAIVNGYKRPFLDLEAMTESTDDIYKSGVKFRWMYDLFMFDRDLRFITFRYLTRAEAVVKTAVVYAFCQGHQEEQAYLDVSNYCSADAVLVPKAFKGNKKTLYQQNLAKLMETLNGKLTIKGKTRPFIKHYIINHGSVPLWVLSNDLTFGNIVHLYQLMQRDDQNRACTIIAKGCRRNPKEDGFLSPRTLLRSANLLVDFRNMCAHDERLYCAKVGNDGFNSMVASLFDVLPKNEVYSFADEIVKLIDEYGERLHHISATTLLKDMGFRVPKSS